MCNTSVASASGAVRLQPHTHPTSTVTVPAMHIHRTLYTHFLQSYFNFYGILKTWNISTTSTPETDFWNHEHFQFIIIVKSVANFKIEFIILILWVQDSLKMLINKNSWKNYTIDTDFFSGHDFIRQPHFPAKKFSVWILLWTVPERKKKKNVNTMHSTVKIVWFFSLLFLSHEGKWVTWISSQHFGTSSVQSVQQNSTN